jgi:copper chaperone CopZ
MHTTVITVGDLDGEQAIAEITNVIHELPGIDTVDVAPETGVVSVEHSPLVSEADIRFALEDAGYEVLS